MLDKPIDEITLADVQGFFADAAKYPERKTIEYKQELHKFKEDRGRVEFAKDVTSLANTSGGHILFGFSEKDGYPTGIPGAQCEDPDEAIRDMRTAIRIATDPRIDVHAVDIHAVPEGSPNRYFFVVRIAQSLNCAACGAQSRQGFGPRVLDSAHQREGCDGRGRNSASLRFFRDNHREDASLPRKADAPYSFGGKDARLYWGRAKCVLHLLPLAAFRRPEPIGLDKIKGNSGAFPPLLSNCGPGESRINLDGYTNFYFVDDGFPRQESPSRGYTLVYQNGGIVESVLASGVVETGRSGALFFDANICERMLLKGFYKFLPGHKGIGRSAAHLVLCVHHRSPRGRIARAVHRTKTANRKGRPIPSRI